MGSDLGRGTASAVDNDVLGTVEAWFKDRNIIPKCPFCGSNSWQAFDHFVTPLVWEQGGVSLGGVAYPTLTLVCTVCGSQQSFNAVVIGLVKSK